MSNEIESSLNDLSIKLNLTPPIRRVAADASSSIPLDNINTNFSHPSILIRQIKKSSSNLIKQSIKKNNNASTTIFRERSISSSSSSSKSSNNDSLRSFSPDISLHHDDDDDASSNDDTNHQWDLGQLVSNIPLRQLSKSRHFFLHIKKNKEQISPKLSMNIKITVFSRS